MMSHSRITIGFAAVLFFIAIFTSIPQKIAGTVATFESPPDGFDPTGYPRIFDTEGNDQIRVIDTRLFGDKWTSSYHLPQQRIFGLSFFSEEDPSALVFFSNDGKQVGIHKRPNDGSFNERRNNEILTPKGYHTVSANGISRLEPYQVIAPEPISAERLQVLQRQSTQIHVVEYYLRPSDSNEAQQKLNILLFKVGTIWKKAFISSETYVSDEYDFPESQLRAYEIDLKGTPAQPREPKVNPQFNIVRDWFDRQEFRTRKNAAIMSPTGSGTPAHWRGVGYYTATIDGHSFRFSIQGEKQSKSFNNRTQAEYSWAPGMQFIQLRPGPESFNFPYLLVEKEQTIGR